MNFWKNVDYVREYRDMSRKELAYKADFSLTSLSTGIKRNSIPSADVAFRIAKTLNVSIEYLLTGKDSAKTDIPDSSNFSQINYLKYKKLIEKIDVLPENIQESIANIIENFFDLIQ